MSWLIIGGSGQLGTAISQELKNRGLQFNAPNSLNLNITLSSIALDYILNLKPKVIVNCAAWTNVDGAEDNAALATRVNSDGAENMARGARACGAKLIQISTDYVFSGQSDLPWQVDDPTNPQSNYGRSKAEGESRVLAAYAENSSIVRTAWLYSPWGKNFAMTMTRLAINGSGLVPVVNDQAGQPTSAVDLAKKLVELGLSDSPSGIYHGTNGGKATWFEFAQEVFKLCNADVSRVVPVSTADLPRLAMRPAYSVLSHEAWTNTSLKPMRDWKMALLETMPSLISAIKAGE
jgi:dTDP-4-dehydrorhamnose reductase